MVQRVKELSSLAKSCDVLAKIHIAVSADELLSSKQMKCQIETFEVWLGVSRQKFKNYYLPVIKNFAEIVQKLPYPQNHSSLLVFSLLDTFSILRRFKNSLGYESFSESEEDFTTITEHNSIYSYAVFSAALLKNLSDAYSQLKVTLLNFDGQPKGDWSILTGPIKRGWYYRVTEVIHANHSELPLEFYRRLLPYQGWIWLAKDESLFADWSSIFLGNRNNRLARVISEMAVKQSEPFFANNDSSFQASHKSKVSMLDSDGAIYEQQKIVNEKVVDTKIINRNTISYHECRDVVKTEHVNFFMQWLKLQLENNFLQLKLTRGSLHCLIDGCLLESPAVLSLFSLYWCGQDHYSSEFKEDFLMQLNCFSLKLTRTYVNKATGKKCEGVFIAVNVNLLTKVGLVVDTDLIKAS